MIIIVMITTNVNKFNDFMMCFQACFDKKGFPLDPSWSSQHWVAGMLFLFSYKSFHFFFHCCLFSFVPHLTWTSEKFTFYVLHFLKKLKFEFSLLVTNSLRTNVCRIKRFACHNLIFFLQQNVESSSTTTYFCEYDQSPAAEVIFKGSLPTQRLYSLWHGMKGCIYSIETHFFFHFFPQLLYFLG